MHYPVENMTIEQLDHMAKTSLMEIFKKQAIDELQKRGVNVIHVSYEGNNDNQKFYDEIKKEVKPKQAIEIPIPIPKYNK